MWFQFKTFALVSVLLAVVWSANGADSTSDDGTPTSERRTFNHLKKIKRIPLLKKHKKFGGLIPHGLVKTEFAGLPVAQDYAPLYKVHRYQGAELKPDFHHDVSYSSPVLESHTVGLHDYTAIESDEHVPVGPAFSVNEKPFFSTSQFPSTNSFKPQFPVFPPASYPVFHSSPVSLPPAPTFTFVHPPTPAPTSLPIKVPTPEPATVWTSSAPPKVPIVSFPPTITPITIPKPVVPHSAVSAPSVQIVPQVLPTPQPSLPSWTPLPPAKFPSLPFLPTPLPPLATAPLPLPAWTPTPPPKTPAVLPPVTGWTPAPPTKLPQVLPPVSPLPTVHPPVSAWTPAPPNKVPAVLPPVSPLPAVQPPLSSWDVSFHTKVPSVLPPVSPLPTFTPISISSTPAPPAIPHFSTFPTATVEPEPEYPYPPSGVPSQTYGLPESDKVEGHLVEPAQHIDNQDVPKVIESVLATPKPDSGIADAFKGWNGQKTFAFNNFNKFKEPTLGVSVPEKLPLEPPATHLQPPVLSPAPLQIPVQFPQVFFPQIASNFPLVHYESYPPNHVQPTHLFNSYGTPIPRDSYAPPFPSSHDRLSSASEEKSNILPAPASFTENAKGQEDAKGDEREQANVQQSETQDVQNAQEVQPAEVPEEENETVADSVVVTKALGPGDDNATENKNSTE